MVSENHSTLDPSTDPDLVGNPPGRVDPLRIAVHAAMAIYLLPVLLLVASIGLVAIVFEGMSRLAGKANAILSARNGSTSNAVLRPQAQVIGSRPVARTPRKPTRVIR
jgi:hypothetical protein